MATSTNEITFVIPGQADVAAAATRGSIKSFHMNTFTKTERW